MQKVILETVGNLDGENQQVFRNTLVRQKVTVFKIRSEGADGIEGVYDDFEVGSFTAVLEEKDLSEVKPNTEISKDPFSGAKGAFGGTIVDLNDAVITGANVDRASLETAKIEEKINRYDVLPDRIIIYAWMYDKPLEFNFKFSPRYGHQCPNSGFVCL